MNIKYKTIGKIRATVLTEQVKDSYVQHGEEMKVNC